MRLGVHFGTACLLAVLSFDSVAHAQSAAVTTAKGVAVATRDARMRSTLARLADANHWNAGKSALQLGVGTLFVGLAGYFAFSKNAEQGSGSGRGAAVILSMMTGAAYLGRGVYSLGGVSTSDERRWARFQQRDPSQPLTDVELARLEAEIELEAELARSARHWEIATSFGVAAGGATLFAFGATSELRGEARELVYIEGGVMLLSGLGLGIHSSLKESASEREWRDYRAGTTRAASPSLRWQVAPVLAPHVAALSVVGQF